ncbi:MAG: type III pantothenate kinase [Gracilimonas sp.]|nr:type III pantothenate kinase [Gracilimonas sp.]
MSKIDSVSTNKKLFLDVGNSSIKGAFKQQMQWETIHPEGNFTASDLLQWIEDHASKFNEIVLSGVRKDVIQAIKGSLTKVPLREITIQDIPRELLDYKTVETLGIDRFLACFGATSQTSNSVVVIDAGTALTLDFMDQDDVFHGGVIAPGINHFMQVLPEKAPALPKVELNVPTTWPGKSTIDSLKWGQAGFYKMAIEHILYEYEKEFGSFELYITGGSGAKIQSLLDREAKHRPFLVFDGLERLSRSLS